MDSESLAWILSGLLAACFLGAGLAKLTTPYEKLVETPQMAWTADFSPGQVRGIAVLEILGAVGVVLPWLLGVLPGLSIAAAIGLAAIMVGAIRTHHQRGELGQMLPINLALLVLSWLLAGLRLGQL